MEMQIQELSDQNNVADKAVVEVHNKKAYTNTHKNNQNITKQAVKCLNIIKNECMCLFS